MLKSPNALHCRCVKLLPLGGLLALATVTSGQQAALPLGVPDDWTHGHVVFSNPGTFAEAVQNGTYDQWARVVSDPRFVLQQRKRAATAKAQMSFPLTALRVGGKTEPADVETTGDAEEPENPSVGAAKPAREREDEGEDRGERHRRHRGKVRSRQHLDWSVNMGAGATLGLGVYPAKFSFDISSANCGTASSPDFVVYGTSLAGSATQASIAAFDNLYTGCGGTVPTVFWAYNTGGTIITSVAFSLDGKEVAFVQTTGTTASLVILKWAPSTGTLGAPATPTNAAPAAYRACTAPCMTSIPFSGGANDTGSSVYTDYSSNTIFAGDDSGKLHKFTPVFGPTPTPAPAEAGAPWPVSLSTEGLSSPVFDPASGNVFVGDFLVSGMPACAVSTCGFLYSVNATSGAVVKSSRLDFIFGLVGSPILDITAARVYAFVGSDNGFTSTTSPCGVRVPCSGIFQFPTNFTTGAAGTEATTGPGTQAMLPGTFDNFYFTSANQASPTGNLYVVGNTGAANNTLYRIPITNNVMGTAAAGPVVSTNFTNGASSSQGMSVTEIFTGTHDYIFTSALVFGAPAACGPGSLTNGCVMGFDITSGTIGPGTLPTGATVAAGGVSGIIIDNVAALAGASNIYYTPLTNQLCTTSGTTGGCAIQVIQSAP